MWNGPDVAIRSNENDEPHRERFPKRTTNLPPVFVETEYLPGAIQAGSTYEKSRELLPCKSRAELSGENLDFHRKFFDIAQKIRREVLGLQGIP